MITQACRTSVCSTVEWNWVVRQLIEWIEVNKWADDFNLAIEPAWRCNTPGIAELKNPDAGLVWVNDLLAMCKDRCSRFTRGPDLPHPRMPTNAHFFLQNERISS